jgi:hypothetical protein
MGMPQIEVKKTAAIGYFLTAQESKYETQQTNINIYQLQLSIHLYIFYYLLHRTH